MPVEPAGIEGHRTVEVHERLFDIGIGMEFDSVCTHFVKSLFADSVVGIILEHEPVHAFAAHQQPGNHQRIIFDVRSPCVQQPRYLVEGGDQAPVGTLLPHPPAEACDLGLPVFAGIHGENRSLGDGRPVGPQGRQQVGHAHHIALHPRRSQFVYYLPDHSGSYAKAVHGDEHLIPAIELEGQPIGDRHLPGNAHLVQFDPGAGKLRTCLDEVPGVGPQSGVVEGHHHVAAFASEAGQPAHLLPAFGRIFAVMRVGAGEDNGIPTVAAHHSTQILEPLGKKIFHIYKFSIFAPK